MAKQLTREEEAFLIGYADELMSRWVPEDQSTKWLYQAGAALKRQARNTWRNTRPRQCSVSPLSNRTLRNSRNV